VLRTPQAQQSVHPPLESAHASFTSPKPELQALPKLTPPGSRPQAAVPPRTQQTETDTNGTVETIQLSDYLRQIDTGKSRYTALKQALSMWNVKLDVKPYLESLEDDQAYFRLLSKPSGVFIHRMEADLSLLRKLNVPAILEFYPPGTKAPGYLTLLKMSGDTVTLGIGSEGQQIVTDPGEIAFYWSGVAYVPWKNYLSIYGTIPKQSFGDSVLALKLLLRDIGFDRLSIDTEYDSQTRDVVESLQNKYGIPVDGFVGPLTKIILYREKQDYSMPQIAQ